MTPAAKTAHGLALFFSLTPHLLDAWDGVHAEAFKGVLQTLVVGGCVLVDGLLLPAALTSKALKGAACDVTASAVLQLTQTCLNLESCCM